MSKLGFNSLKIKIRPKRYKIYGEWGYIGSITKFCGQWKYRPPYTSTPMISQSEIMDIYHLIEIAEKEH